ALQTGIEGAAKPEAVAFWCTNRQHLFEHTFALPSGSSSSNDTPKRETGATVARTIRRIPEKDQ
ncbi:MAG: hypothetical protein AAGA05_00685, partial [Pseudomonadota bacterium]